jgi:hypothetical protein
MTSVGRRPSLVLTFTRDVTFVQPGYPISSTPKTLSRQKWLLSNMPYRGREDRAVWACVIARTTWPLQCQLAAWKSNEALFVFLWSEAVKPSEIYRRMKVQYGESCLSQGRVYERAERFQNRWQNVSDGHRRGRPVGVATGTVKQQIKRPIRDYRRVTMDEIAV